MELRCFLDGHPTGFIGTSTIVGSCNGLLCVQTRVFHTLPPTLYILNPAIREVMQVPRIRTTSDVVGYSFGFGFSPSVNDYKIVIIYMGALVGHNVMIGRVAVCSLTTKSWKDIEFGIVKGRSFCSQSLNVDGSIFWLARNVLIFEGWKFIALALVSFDLALEEFKVIPTPLSRGEGVAKLAVYEKRLALLHSSFAPNSVIDLWVIEEGIGASWSKMFTFGPYPYHLRPLTICRSQIVGTIFYTGKFQFMEEEGEKKEKKDDIFFINLTSNEFKVIADRRYGRSGCSFEYVESLLSPSNIELRKP
ncbi:unnamed protein product [Cuscuta epithymum]|uniref:F-box associated beta-propeller type 3 domain-containing protein n=1 Tax=Cuscuta epithymum TaxID=186058 RepID=A0AAV0DB86_9ASTE|nr:unnamed protein product [Cuscuta epithymum]